MDPAPTRRLVAVCRQEVHLVHADGANVGRIEADAGDEDKEELVVAVQQPCRSEAHPFGEINQTRIEVVECRVVFCCL